MRMSRRRRRRYVRGRRGRLGRGGPSGVSRDGTATYQAELSGRRDYSARVCEEEPTGASQFSERFRGVGNGGRSEGDIARVVDRGGPDAQRVGAVPGGRLTLVGACASAHLGAVDHFHRGQAVAGGFAHLLTVFVHDEAVGDEVFVRGGRRGGEVREQRRLKPAAVWSEPSR
jgi:hypothetical protein